MSAQHLSDADRARLEPLLDVAEVAELLGVPKSWVYAEARANRLPHVALGRYRRFRREAIERWVGERERGPVGGGPSGG